MVINKKGTKTNFSNQIDLLKFLKFYSSHYPREYYAYAEDREDYGNILIDAVHPVCTPVTAYSLNLM